MDRFRVRQLALGCVCFALSLGSGCDGATDPTSAQEASSSRDDGHEGLATSGAAPSNGAPTPAETCDASVSAVVTSDRGDITYTNATVTAEALHSGESGCMTGLTLGIDQGGPCPLNLSFETLEGAWRISAGSLNVSGACGATMDVAASGSYTLDPSLSTGGLDGQPEVAVVGGAGCHPASELSITGLAHFTSTDGTLVLNLNGLTLSGDVLSSVGPQDTCPASIPQCIERTCGMDAFGKACGECPEGEACVDGGCRVWNCPPGAPFGTKPGENLTDIELRDCDGNPVFLHELCGADAAYFNLLAGW